ncbi:MAG: hypothetical protein KDI09_04845 [Halioglobus sp.]|nr:hypothetical protein [Halioglobus sp.]
MSFKHPGAMLDCDEVIKAGVRVNRRIGGWLWLLLCFRMLALQAVAADAAGVAASGLTLSDGVDAIAAVPWTSASLYQSSSWLGSVPSLSLSYLESEESLGTDETEVALNLPLKSPARHRADAQLRTLDAELSQAREEYRRLYFSGLLREAFWAFRRAEVQWQGAMRKGALLEELLARQRALAAAAVTPAYASLIVQREVLNAQAGAEIFEGEMARWQSRYRELTGLPLPAAAGADEATVPEQAAGAFAHPQLRLLELNWARLQALLAANAGTADNWNLSLVGKQLDAPGLEDQQWGVALEVPLSVFGVVNESTRSDWSAGSSEFQQARDEALQSIAGRYSALRDERASLLRQRRLVEQADALNARIAEQLDALHTGNEIENEMWLRRRLDIMDTAVEMQLLQVRLGENAAMQRQTLGVPL